jgi:hypothetical protein
MEASDLGCGPGEGIFGTALGRKKLRQLWLILITMTSKLSEQPRLFAVFPGGKRVR